MKTALAALALLAVAVPTDAQPPAPAAQPSSAALASAAEALVRLLRGETPPEALFTPAFLAQVPAAQVTAISAQLRAQNGAVRGLGRLEASSPNEGVAFVDYERATVRFNFGIDPSPPHLVRQLLLAGMETRGDTIERLAADIRALPGQSAFAIARLGDGDPALLGANEADRPLAIGSTFKLFILAELSRQVRAGERRWSDVVRLDRRSLPSGILQDWPLGAPVTLYTLAGLMISRSDNTATDALLSVVGRDNVERLLPTLGVRAAERNRPFLSTLELFALKAMPEADFRAWAAADEAGRRRILAQRFAGSGPEGIDFSRIGAEPRRIDSLEWFASASDLVRTMDWLRRNGDAEAQAILAIAPGVPAATAAELGYVGYKGGSEPGVINMTFLVRNRGGTWHAVSGSWNDPAAPVDEARFAALMLRAVQLVR
jgi:beta-lactamase class A